MMRWALHGAQAGSGAPQAGRRRGARLCAEIRGEVLPVVLLRLSLSPSTSLFFLVPVVPVVDFEHSVRFHTRERRSNATKTYPLSFSFAGTPRTSLESFSFSCCAECLIRALEGLSYTRIARLSRSVGGVIIYSDGQRLPVSTAASVTMVFICRAIWRIHAKDAAQQRHLLDHVTFCAATHPRVPGLPL